MSRRTSQSKTEPGSSVEPDVCPFQSSNGTILFFLPPGLNCSVANADDNGESDFGAADAASCGACSAGTAVSVLLSGIMDELYGIHRKDTCWNWCFVGIPAQPKALGAVNEADETRISEAEYNLEIVYSP